MDSVTTNPFTVKVLRCQFDRHVGEFGQSKLVGNESVRRSLIVRDVCKHKVLERGRGNITIAVRFHHLATHGRKKSLVESLHKYIRERTKRRRYDGVLDLLDGVLSLLDPCNIHICTCTAG